MAARRITLFDVMVLVTATAIGLWLSKFGWPSNGGGVRIWLVLQPSGGYVSKTWMLPYAERVALFLPCLAAWSGAILVMRLRGPRPPRRRLVRQPGFVAAVIVVGVLCVESLILVGSAQIDGRFGWASPSDVTNFATNAIVLLAHHAGWAVAVAWLVLALSGRWRPEPSWIDRCGRALGFVWIIIAPLASILIDHGTWWGRFLNP